MNYLKKYLQQKSFSNLEKNDRSLSNLSKYLYNTCGYPIYNGGNIEYFENGEKKFEKILEDLKNAKDYIFIEYFIIDRGYMWDSILEILKQKAKDGVEIRVMYDGM